jgi:phosphoserine aminotransferase
MTTVAKPLSPAAAAASEFFPFTRGTFNFSAGPGCLPEEVLRQAQQDMWNIGGTGIGILEHSHRGKIFDKILAEAMDDCRKVGNIPANYKILFLTGGATTQNHMVPMNLLPQGATADYLVSGYWAEKSAEQVKLFGVCHEAYAGKADNYAHIPADNEIKYSQSPSYVHYTSNNTIYGTQWHRIPTPPPGVPLVCDMSSDMYCGPLDISKFGLIYAGAQKNVGAAGTTLVIIREDLLERKPRELPPMLSYKVQAKDESRHNTPPVFNIYLTGLVFKWILKQGGVAAMQKYNQEKAKLIYDVLDSSGFYKGHASNTAPSAPWGSRSLMNITFRTPTAELDDKFVKEAGAAGLDGMKGHRATGGMRASTYNAFPRKGCEALAQFMREFERKNG